METLRPLPRRRIIEILKANGFEEVRSGKHTAFKKNAAGGLTPGCRITMR